MRVLRTIAAGAMLALAVIGASAATVSAAPAESESYPVHEEWCFVDIDLTYCTVTLGHFKVLVTADGDERVATHLRDEVVITDTRTGAYVGSYTTIVNDQFRYGAGPDFGMSIKSVEHTKAVDGDLTCTSHSVLKIADYELQIDRVSFNCR